MTIVITSGVTLGVLLQLALRWYLNWYSKQQANSQAKDIIETATEKADELLDYAKESAADFERELQEKNQKEIENSENKIHKLKSKIGQLTAELKSLQSDLNNKLNKSKQVVDNYQNLIDAKEARIKKQKDEIRKKKSEYAQKLAEKSEINLDEFVGDIAKKEVERANSQMSDWIEKQEEECAENSERISRSLISRVLNRFIRPYCPERGIGFLVLKHDKDVQKMLGPDNENILYLEELCGIDIIYNERAKSLSVSGFDPVRRELARATLEDLVRQKSVNKEQIKNSMEKCKKKLFRNIRNDGNSLTKELRLKNMSEEIRNMMGALKYRYSFTQNQYYHCAEVGHLCGLLSGELGMDRDAISAGKRAGLLHDLGKAMDHSIDGGHAVIGADFIEKHGEEKEIVHAVRAHHYDEPPETDLAFLVIAADAISGARPGARRSTTSTYVQKMNQLQEIGNSFDGVIDTFILSAGREVRITVDNDKVSDVAALELSKDIATKIEKDCNYPGTIKVTVVRQSQAVEMAR